MSYHNHGHAGSCKLLHQFQDLSYHLRIKSRCRLIKQHHVRVHGKRSCNGDTLLLTAGKHVRIGICLIRKTYSLQKLQCRFFSLFLTHKIQSHRCEHNVLFYCLMWKKIKLLEYHSDLLTMTVDIHLGICDVGSLKEDFSPGRLLKEIQGTEECRFTTAGWSDNGYYFTSADLCGDPVENLIAAIGLFKSLYIQKHFITYAHWFSASFQVFLPDR